MSERRRSRRSASQPRTAPLRRQAERARDEPAAASARPAPDALAPGRTARHDQRFTDVVTLLEIAPSEEGGAREIPLPGDRSLSPPSPPAARRTWEHSVARTAIYFLVAVVLIFILVVILIDVFRLG